MELFCRAQASAKEVALVTRRLSAGENPVPESDRAYLSVLQAAASGLPDAPALPSRSR